MSEDVGGARFYMWRQARPKSGLPVGEFQWNWSSPAKKTEVGLGVMRKPLSRLRGQGSIPMELQKLADDLVGAEEKEPLLLGTVCNSIAIETGGIR